MQQHQTYHSYSKENQSHDKFLLGDCFFMSRQSLGVNSLFSFFSVTLCTKGMPVDSVTPTEVLNLHSPRRSSSHLHTDLTQ